MPVHSCSLLSSLKFQRSVQAVCPCSLQLWQDFYFSFSVFHEVGEDPAGDDDGADDREDDGEGDGEEEAEGEDEGRYGEEDDALGFPGGVLPEVFGDALEAEILGGEEAEGAGSVVAAEGGLPLVLLLLVARGFLGTGVGVDGLARVGVGFAFGHFADFVFVIGHGVASILFCLFLRPL